ncbi:hypothetical protein [Streptomyces sp. NBC_00503]|uniref:hypothetical protein n=1 Tax=Streptomyces sp. NBC_00503 TaxID=2903659 RepID=UPI002E81AC91|nr:hypothetical protein [Streptomyces sp. NBC_00503]WUD79510.1 hypothetical protein OG490_02370 [Streptomyces sp. NBC_00503]
MASADSTTTAVRRPASAWALENAVFSAAMAAQRLPWTDAPARALGLDALTPDGVARSLLAHLRRTRSGRPVRLRTPFGEFLVPLTPAESEALLDRAGEEGRSEPPVGLTAGGHRYGLPPHAALHTDPHRDLTAPDGDLSTHVGRAVEEAIGARRTDGTLEWQDWHDTMMRLSRRLVMGNEAAEDTLLSELVARSQAAGTDTADRRAREEWAAALRRRLAPYLENPDPASLVGRLVAPESGPDTDTGTGAGTSTHTSTDTVGGAAVHALALVSLAATTIALQALALHTVEPTAAPEESVDRALRHYPPVAAAVYRVRASFVWEGLAIDAGTEILSAPGWLEPPKEAALPGAWPSALCAGPSDCAATRFAALVAAEIVRALTTAARPFLVSPVLTADRLPATLDPRTLLVSVGELSAHPTGRRVPTAVPASAHGCTPATYGVLARASAERLESHAESLAACAEDPGWNEDEAGEKFRMVLIGHAERCAKAADGVRRAADRLEG